MAKIEFTTKFRYDLENFVLELFENEDNISVLCDGELVSKLLNMARKQRWRTQFVSYTSPFVEYIVSKFNGNLICEYACNRAGDYKTISGDYIIIVGDESKFNNIDYDFKKVYIIEELDLTK